MKRTSSPFVVEWWLSESGSTLSEKPNDDFRNVYHYRPSDSFAAGAFYYWRFGDNQYRQGLDSTERLAADLPENEPKNVFLLETIFPRLPKSKAAHGRPNYEARENAAGFASDFIEVLSEVVGVSGS